MKNSFHTFTSLFKEVYADKIADLLPLDIDMFIAHPYIFKSDKKLYTRINQQILTDIFE